MSNLPCTLLFTIYTGLPGYQPHLFQAQYMRCLPHWHSDGCNGRSNGCIDSGRSSRRTCGKAEERT